MTENMRGIPRRPKPLLTRGRVKTGQGVTFGASGLTVRMGARLARIVPYEEGGAPPHIAAAVAAGKRPEPIRPVSVDLCTDVLLTGQAWPVIVCDDAPAGLRQLEALARALGVRLDRLDRPCLHPDGRFVRAHQPTCLARASKRKARAGRCRCSEDGPRVYDPTCGPGTATFRVRCRDAELLLRLGTADCVRERILPAEGDPIRFGGPDGKWGYRLATDARKAKPPTGGKGRKPLPWGEQTAVPLGGPASGTPADAPEISVCRGVHFFTRNPVVGAVLRHRRRHP